MLTRRLLTPISLPIYCFGLAIAGGGALLRLPASLAEGRTLSWIDALFTAASAVCVTGLAVVDTGTHFSRFGQAVILTLIQLGGLGVMTYASLVLYLWRQRVSLVDRIAVGQSLLHDPSFKLGRFLSLMVGGAMVVEGAGAVLLWRLDPAGFEPFSAAFHSVSAFCNAGFGLKADSLVGWRGSWGANLTIMALITLGGLGFSVLAESCAHLLERLRQGRAATRRLSLHTRTVLRVSLFLTLTAGVGIFAAEGFLHSPGSRMFPVGEAALASLFQSVTCRTAGFNTLDIASMTNISLALMLLLMFVGGSPGSCAGGVKTTTFRALAAFVSSQLLGRPQVVIGSRALDHETMNKALTLCVFGFLAVALVALALDATEALHASNPLDRGQFLEILFEVVSAFGTVGLSMGVTPRLSAPGKAIIITMMFLGRLGPILFLSVLQAWRTKPRYAWAEDNFMIG